ncbi:hypothetical protein J6590_012833 [Homalodisca vitripennis]|nr:hypothetical protein J6590_012833 [Homalodisca vitripennis]
MAEACSFAQLDPSTFQKHHCTLLYSPSFLANVRAIQPPSKRQKHAVALSQSHQASKQSIETRSSTQSEPPSFLADGRNTK